MLRILSAFGASARYETRERGFLWLVNAGMALKTDLVTEAKAPLERTVRSSKFKLYQSDAGMLVSRYAQGIARAVHLDFRDPNLGGVYENVIAQEIVAAGGRPRYYMTAEHREVDFVVETAVL